MVFPPPFFVSHAIVPNKNRERSCLTVTAMWEECSKKIDCVVENMCEGRKYGKNERTRNKSILKMGGFFKGIQCPLIDTFPTCFCGYGNCGMDFWRNTLCTSLVSGCYLQFSQEFSGGPHRVRFCFFLWVWPVKIRSQIHAVVSYWARNAGKKLRTSAMARSR